jgi:hypothetical protein
MRRIHQAWAGAALLAAAGSLLGCSDVGDTTPGSPGQSVFPDDAAGVSTDGGAVTVADATTEDAAASTEASVDAGVDGTIVTGSDAGDATTSVPDAGAVVDSSAPLGTGVRETGVVDAGAPDTATVVDSGVPDTGGGPPEAGPPEASAPEASAPEASAPEAGMDAGITVEAGVPEAAAPDTGGGSGPPDSGGGGGPSPCAMFNNPSGVTTVGCSATEQLFVNVSLDCYTCLIDNSCLDDQEFGDMGHECEDLTGNATGGASAGTSNVQLCLDTIRCVLQSKCASTDVSTCYCGSLMGSACATSTNPGDGLCASQEASGADHLVTDPASVVSPTLSMKVLPAGMADEIFSCAANNTSLTTGATCASICSP